MNPDNTTPIPTCTGGDVITTSCSAENNRFKHTLCIFREREGGREKEREREKERKRGAVMEFNGPGGKGVCDLVFISTDLMSVSRQMLRNSIALY